jgi:hypothetical protein
MLMSFESKRVLSDSTGMLSAYFSPSGRQVELSRFQSQVRGLLGAWAAHNQVKQNDACSFARYMKRLAADRLAAMLAQKFHYVPPASVEMTTVAEYGKACA